MRPLCGCMHTYTSLYKSTDNYNKSETMYVYLDSLPSILNGGV